MKTERMDCLGCLEERMECYKWQRKGYDTGLSWIDGHCFVFVLNERGNIIVY